MMIKDVALTDTTPYGGGQVLDIDTEEMNVTFIAHRGWGPDGRTIYYIVTDATPSGPAGMMGVVKFPYICKLDCKFSSSRFVSIQKWFDRNGSVWDSSLELQQELLEMTNYSPMWRIFMIGWDDPHKCPTL